MNHTTIGLFYGSSTCYTEMAAEKIAAQLAPERVDIFNIADEPIAHALAYQHIIFGIPTWDYGELQEDWEEIWDDMDDLDFSGHCVAIYGMGDQEGYPEWFLDAMGFLFHKLVNLGATMVGYWPNHGYKFEASKALTDDETHFLGLALDEDSQFELSDARIKSWCAQITHEFDLTD